MQDNTTRNNATRTIEAKIGPKLLRNSRKFFSASARSMMTELVQNARRAGATTITFSIAAGTLTVTDDGRGLPAEKADTLLTLGGSANDAGIELGEDAAGIGFFAIGGYDVRVRSADWSMNIPSDAFSGEARATMETDLGRIVGMSVAMSGIVDVAAGRTQAPAKGLTCAFTPQDLADAAVKATMYSGLACVLEDMPRVEVDDHDVLGKGSYVELPLRIVAHQRVEPRGFLDGYSRNAASLLDTHVPGATIRIVRSEEDVKSVINFHGSLLKVKDTCAAPILAALPAVEEIGGIDPRTKRVSVKKLNVAVLIDVHTVGTLSLKLPDRSDVVADGGVAVAADAAVSAYVRLLRSPGTRNGLPLTHPLRTTWADIPLNDARIAAKDGDEWSYGRHDLLATSDGAGARTILDAEGKVVAVDEVICDPDDSYLLRLANASGVAVMAYSSRDAEGALGGDRRTLARMSIVVRDKGVETQTGEFDVGDFEFENMPEEFKNADFLDGVNAVDEIEARVVTTRPGHPDKPFVVAMPCIAWSDDYCTDEPDVLVSRGAGANGTAVQAMKSAIDWESDDSQSDSYESQEEAIIESYEEIVAKALGQGRDHLIETIRSEVAWRTRPLYADRDDLEELVICIRITRDPNDGTMGRSAIEVVEKPRTIA